jgi:hypothetical protein
MEDIKSNKMKLGDLVEKIISIITFGQGHRIALSIAKFLGYDDCGCKARKTKLNKFWDKVLKKKK